MSTWTSFVKIWTVSNCKFNANFLTFLGLYHLLFALETIWWLNLNLVCCYFIITVIFFSWNWLIGFIRMSTSRTKAPTYENVIWKNFLNTCLDIFHFWGHTRVMRNSHKSMPIGKNTSFLFLHMVSFKQGQNSKHQKPCEGQKNCY